MGVSSCNKRILVTPDEEELPFDAEVVQPLLIIDAETLVKELVARDTFAEAKTESTFDAVNLKGRHDREESAFSL